MENLKYFMEHLLPIFFVLCFIALSLLLVIFIGALCCFIYDWLDDKLYDLRVWVKSLKSRKP